MADSNLKTEHKKMLASEDYEGHSEEKGSERSDDGLEVSLQEVSLYEERIQEYMSNFVVSDMMIGNVERQLCFCAMNGH